MQRCVGRACSDLESGCVAGFPGTGGGSAPHAAGDARVGTRPRGTACVALGAREVVPGVSGAVVWMRRVRQAVQRSGVDAGLRMSIIRDGFF